MSDFVQQPQRPAVFVGSSREGLEIARAIQFHLRDDAFVTVWNEGVFGLMKGTLESLVQMLDRFDFAILVITPDDVISARDVAAQAPRDNVMFELGLFMGRLGRSRTFALCSDSPALKLPSDLAGVTMARFHTGDATRDIVSAIGPASFQIRTVIRDCGPLNRLQQPPEKPVSPRARELLVTENSLKLEYIYGPKGPTRSTGTWKSNWRHIFDATAPYMLTPNQVWSLEEQLRVEVMKDLRRRRIKPGEDYDFAFAEKTRNMIKVRLVALGVIKVDQTEHGHETWELTDAGRALLIAFDEERHS